VMRIARGVLGRLTVQIALGGLIVVVIVGVLVIYGVDAELRREQEQRTAADLERIRDQFSDQFEVYQDLVLVGASWIALLDGIHTAIAAGNGDEAARIVEGALGPFTGAESEIDIGVYDATGALLAANVPAAAAHRVNTPPAVFQAIESRSPVRIARLDDRIGPALSATAPVIAPGGELVGAIDAMIAIDDAFAQNYGSSLGVELMLVVEDQPVATSVPGEFESTDWAIEPGPGETGYVEGASERHLTATLPLLGLGGEPIGSFYLGVPESAMSGTVAAERGNILRVVGLGLALAAVLAVATAWLTTRPLRDLMGAARRIQSNELDRPVPIAGAGELRDLARAMEEMRTALRQSRATLLSANQELASRVDMSTENLAEVTSELDVMHRVLAQLDGEPPGGLPGVAEALARLEWVNGSVIGLANRDGGLSIAAIAQVSPAGASGLVTSVNAYAANESITDGWYVPETAEERLTAGLATRGIGGLALHPMVTPDGIAGFIAVVSNGRLALTPGRDELLRSVTREVSLALERSELAGEAAESRRIAESVLREMSDGVLVVDHAGICRAANPAACRLLGRTANELVGEDPGALLPIVEGSPIEWLRERAGRDGPVASIVAEIGGRQVAISSSLFAEPVQAHAGMLVMMRDLSAETEAERVKQDFVSMVGHELRTPLTMIRTTVDLLHGGDAGDLNETQERVVGVLRNNSDRLMTLINDLLDMSALDSGRMQISPDWVDIGNAVTANVEAHRAEAEAKQHTLTVSAPPGLSVWADRSRVDQIMGNLVGNAIKYTPPGGVIAVTVHPAGDFAEIAVSDNGIGIPPHEQDHLFEKFYRASSGRRTTGGTGLGLAIAQSLVELHGGTIHVDSDGESGSTFTVTLPRAEPGAG
jgi:PAS domain S-box-containing protein